MADEYTQQWQSRGKSRRERVEYARSRDILDVANELNMELFREGRDYRWKEHDSLVITPDKNVWNWFSRHQGGDVISLVEVMKEVDFNQAINFLNDGRFKERTVMERVQEPFSYYLAPYEQPFEAARDYLQNQRGLSAETIDFFLEKGVLAQANAKVKGSIEPVIVFKSFDFSGEILGATLQGIEENREKWTERGYAKKIMPNSDGLTGLHVDIGQPNRLIFAESAIDLMSYYELHKDSLQDVRLVSMDGLKEGVIGRHLAQLQSELSGRPLNWNYDQLAEGLQIAIDKNFFVDGKHSDWITLAVDNDEGGQNFISSLREKGAVVNEALPDLQPGQVKTDWNDYLKEMKKSKEQPPKEETLTSFDNLSEELMSSKTAEQESDFDGFTTVSRIIIDDRTWNKSDPSKEISGTVVKVDVSEQKPDVEQLVEESEAKEKAPDVNQTQEKSLDNNQETNTGGELFNRSSSFLGENSPGTAPQPVEPASQPDFPTNVPLYFNIDKDIKSNFRLRKGYHYPKNKDVRNISAYAEDIQKSATWYLNELADTTVTYFYKDGLKQQALQVKFEKRHWMHLTGIAPVYSEKLDSVSETFIDEISSGHTSFQNVTVGPGYLDKIQILPMLSEVLETDSFVFDDLSSIEKFGRLDAESTIRSEDKSIVLAFQTDSQDEMFPASLLKPGLDLNIQMDTLSQEKTILGVLIEKDGDIRVHRINANYIRDNGAEMVEFLNSQRSNETQWTQSLPEKQVKESEPSVMDSNVELEVSAEDFTKVLDAVYNVGIPDDLARVPEEVLAAWQKYLEVSEENQWGLEQMVDYADKNSLLVKDSAFYKEWQEDMIYKNDYHVRLQFAENWDNGVELPFHTEQLIDYKTFVTGLYEANQAHYQRRQENQLPYTKTEFDIYAPGGQLIKDNVHYAIGDETRPVSQLMGLGYRRLSGYQDLAAIDDSVLSQLENQELNQEIAAEANEHLLNSQEIPQEDSRPRETFTSPKQDIKMGLAQRVEEIMAEDAKKQLEVAAPRVQESLSMEGDLVGTPQADGSVIYTNREEFGQGYQIELTVYSPEKVDNLSETTAPWTIALLRGEENLGYLAYGSDWGNGFQIEEELEKLVEAIKANKLPKELYKQEEVDAFLANSTGQGKPQETTVSAEPFDYNTASAYEISERAFQKIREYTQSPEDLKAYMDFMSKFLRLSPRNVALIQEQWRGANAVATYNQWQAMGEVLDIKPEDVIPTKAIYTNKRTGETKEVVHQNLSVKTGEKSKITLFRPVLVKMIPVLDENGNQLKNDKGNPKFKKLSEATPQEKQWVKEGKLPVRQFQERDFKTGQPRYTTYKVFELSQTTLKPESYPKAMPNRHYNFNMDKVKTKEVLEGLCDYADSIGVTIMKDKAHVLDNRKGAFYPEEQLILINPHNTPGEKIATTIHELAHATLHNPKMVEQYKELPRGQREFEAEMTSHLLSKHFGLDTSEKAIKYMAAWTDNLKALDDKQLANSLGRVHKTVSKMLKQVESHTKPYQGKSRGHAQNFSRTPNKGISR